MFFNFVLITEAGGGERILYKTSFKLELCFQYIPVLSFWVPDLMTLCPACFCIRRENNLWYMAFVGDLNID